MEELAGNESGGLAATPLRSLPLRLKGLRPCADSDSDSRLGTDGNQPGLENEKGRRTTPPFSLHGSGFASANPDVHKT
jgi:hypothetical protein